MVKRSFILAAVALVSLGVAQQKAPATPVQDPSHAPTEVGVAPDPLDTASIEGVTFAEKAKEVYVPLREFAELINWELAYDEESKETLFEGKVVPTEAMRTLFDGTTLVAMSSLPAMGIEVQQVTNTLYGVKVEGRSYEVTIPEKFVEVSIGHQVMRAWQGRRLVMKTNVSSGAPGHATPMGKYKTGPIKQADKVSSIYESAPMPWSVQVVGDIFVHGSNSVPRYPASHGCIRMPLTGRNAARYFFKWVDLGVRVNILASWSDEAQNLIALEPDGADQLAKNGHVTPPTKVGTPPVRKKKIVASTTPRKPIVVPKPNPNAFIGPKKPGG